MSLEACSQRGCIGDPAPVIEAVTELLLVVAGEPGPLIPESDRKGDTMIAKAAETIDATKATTVPKAEGPIVPVGATTTGETEGDGVGGDEGDEDDDWYDDEAE